MSDEIVVLARGNLAGEQAALAVRVALALPLAGLSVRLVLVDAASTLGLASAPDLGPRGGGVDRELDALLREEEAPVLVESESLEALGLAGRPLRPGVEVVPRRRLADICAAGRSCLVI